MTTTGAPAGKGGKGAGGAPASPSGPTLGAGRARKDRSDRPRKPLTLAIDIGGTGLKASVLDQNGRLIADRVRVPTPYPCDPATLVQALVTLVAPLPDYDRVSGGFPGVVRDGIVRTAPHFVLSHGPGTRPSPALERAWSGFDIATALTDRLGRPARVINDADLQGLAIVSGVGLELVVTLGTGVGTGLFEDGKLAPHFEIAHVPFKNGQTYNDRLGDQVLKRIGPKRWRSRVKEAINILCILLNYDHLYLGGGNARHLAGHVDKDIVIVDNIAGILGGIKLWEQQR